MSQSLNIVENVENETIIALSQAATRKECVKYIKVVETRAIRNIKKLLKN